MSFLQVSHSTTMSVNSVWISCGAALSCDAVSGVSVKQDAHISSLQLNTLNHSTMQADSAPQCPTKESIVCKIFWQIGHCRCSRVAGLLELASKWSSSKHPVGGAIARMSTMIIH